MNLRRASVVGLVAVLCLTLHTPPAARAAAEDTGQIQFVNDTGNPGTEDSPLGVAVDFYLDGKLVGTVLPFDSLTIDAEPGNHDVEAKSKAVGNVSKRLTVDAGETTVWTITLK